MGMNIQLSRVLFASFSPSLGHKGQQEPPNESGGHLFPKATSTWLFALTPGPQVQAREYILVFPCLVSAKHPQSVPAADLEQQSGGAVLPSELGPASDSSHLESRVHTLHKHFIHPPSKGVAAVAHRPCFKKLFNHPSSLGMIGHMELPVNLQVSGPLLH